MITREEIMMLDIMSNFDWKRVFIFQAIEVLNLERDFISRLFETDRCGL